MEEKSNGVEAVSSSESKSSYASKSDFANVSLTAEFVFWLIIDSKLTLQFEKSSTMSLSRTFCVAYWAFFPVFVAGTVWYSIVYFSPTSVIMAGCFLYNTSVFFASMI